jgi:uncharacterized protein YdeI (YjbR/CyaY-like superfamily)
MEICMSDTTKRQLPGSDRTFQSPDNLPVLAFAGASELEQWLENEHQSSGGLWLAIAKKDTGVSSITYAQAVELALCFGWIDGQRRALDETYFLQRFTPRKARSPWSKVNRTKAEALIESGRMRAAGVAEIERARTDGRWDSAYAGAKTATVPPDLQAELDVDPAAAEFFASLSSQNRFSIIYRINEAKKPETRQRRLEKSLEMLRNQETIHPQ